MDSEDDVKDELSAPPKFPLKPTNGFPGDETQPPGVGDIPPSDNGPMGEDIDMRMAGFSRNRRGGGDSKYEMDDDDDDDDGDVDMRGMDDYSDNDRHDRGNFGNFNRRGGMEWNGPPRGMRGGRGNNRGRGKGRGGWDGPGDDYGGDGPDHWQGGPNYDGWNDNYDGGRFPGPHGRGFNHR